MPFTNESAHGTNAGTSVPTQRLRSKLEGLIRLKGRKNACTSFEIHKQEMNQSARQASDKGLPNPIFDNHLIVLFHRIPLRGQYRFSYSIRGRNDT